MSGISFLGPKFISSAGEHDLAHVTGAPAVAVYFSAHWCPPCRNFTPKLAKFYEKANANGKKIEIVFVSLDQDEDSFADYFKTMPWVATPFSADKKAEIQAKIPFTGIPYLAVLTKNEFITSSPYIPVKNDQAA